MARDHFWLNREIGGKGEMHGRKGSGAAQHTVVAWQRRPFRTVFSCFFTANWERLGWGEEHYAALGKRRPVTLMKKASRRNSLLGKEKINRKKVGFQPERRGSRGKGKHSQILK